MNSKILVTLTIISLLLAGCGGNEPAQPTETATLVSSTNTATLIPPTPTQIQPTGTPEPDIVIVLSNGTSNSLNLEVKKGSYKIVSGATLRAGSSIPVSEDWLTFPPDLVIEIGAGGVTLQGVTYEEGTILTVNGVGEITAKGTNGGIPALPTATVTVTATPNSSSSSKYKLQCDINAQQYGFGITGETGTVQTTYNNEAKNFNYDSSGMMTGITVSVNRDLLFTGSQHKYHIEGTITVNQTTNEVAYDITATSDAFGGSPQTCKKP